MLAVMQKPVYVKLQCLQSPLLSLPRAAPFPQEAQCPPFVVERTTEQRRAQSFERCLLEHGVNLDSGYPNR